MIMVAIGSVMYYGMNLVLMRLEHVRVGLGEVGTAVFGAILQAAELHLHAGVRHQQRRAGYCGL